MNYGPGGPCERCGGPQWWTVVRGEMWVACQAECEDDQMDLFGRNPPLIALLPEPDGDRRNTEAELFGGGGVVPCEGGDARTSEGLIHISEVPPPRFLELLWEGSDAETIG